jgi:hypothetical protein
MTKAWGRTADMRSDRLAEQGLGVASDGACLKHGLETPRRAVSLQSVFENLDLGDVPTWLATIGAAFAAAFAFRALRVEQRRDDRQEIADASAQAEQVAAWVAENVQQRPGGARAKTMVVALRNASDLPAYDVTLTVLAIGGSTDLETIPVLPPGETSIILPRDIVLPVLGGIPGRANFPRDVSVRMLFRDAAGRHWLRDEKGALSPSDV